MSKHRGFTLIELLIVITIIAIIAAIAIPYLTSARSAANEKTVIATLRAIVTAQELVRTNTTVDVNVNGQGEACTLAELAGTATLRGSTMALYPPTISAALGQLDANGFVQSKGFYFAIYLPDAAGQGLATTVAKLPNVSAGLSESYWTCLAWPRDRRAQGHGTFFTNQNGDILVAHGADYSGTTNPPPPGAALLGVAPDQIDTTLSAAATDDGIGADGNVWRVVH